MSMVDLVVLMKDGYIQQMGILEEFYYKLVNIFVVEFVGVFLMVLIEGEVLLGFGDVVWIGFWVENVQVIEFGVGWLVCMVIECEFFGLEIFIGLLYFVVIGLMVSLLGLWNILVGEEMEIFFLDEYLYFFDCVGWRFIQMLNIK